MKIIKSAIQRIKCLIPLKYGGFHLGEIEVVSDLGYDSQKIRCVSCGKEFAINFRVKAIIPWDDDLECFYKYRYKWFERHGNA